MYVLCYRLKNNNLRCLKKIQRHFKRFTYETCINKVVPVHCSSSVHCG